MLEGDARIGVTSVKRGSLADKKKIQMFDTILKVNGQDLAHCSDKEVCTRAFDMDSKSCTLKICRKMKPALQIAEYRTIALFPGDKKDELSVQVFQPEGPVEAATSADSSVTYCCS